MSSKSKDTDSSTARAAGKADRARDGARAMQEYVERRTREVAKTERLRALRLAREEALERQRKVDEKV
jgi:hypothetical protein